MDCKEATPLKACLRLLQGYSTINTKIPMRRHDRRSPVLLWALSFMICLLPCRPLLNPRITFESDWANHLWLIECYAQYFRFHHSFPAIINTNECIGIPLTLFYADRFYTFAGIIASLLGSAGTIRVLVFLALLGQCRALIKAFAPWQVGAGFSIAVCASVTFSIYPLTNLYNRGAIPEFFAGVFFTIALCLMFSALVAARSGEPYLLTYAGSFIFFCATALTHPLTGWFGAAIFGPFWLLAAVAIKRWRFFIEGLFGILLTAVALSPWLYSVVVFGRRLPVTDSHVNEDSFRKTFFFAGSIDAWSSRLSPVAIDFRSLRNGIKVMTPYLDAQANVALMIFVIAAAFQIRKCRKAGIPGDRTPAVLTAGGLMGAFVYLVVSLNPSVSKWTGGYFDLLQFPYRLTAFINYGLLLAAFGIALRVYGTRFFGARSFRGLVGVVVCISSLGLVTKLPHAEILGVTNPEGDRQVDGSRLTNLPDTFYAMFMYAVRAGYDPRPPGSNPQDSCALKISEGRQLGRVSPLTVNHDQPVWLATNVVPFPWNRLTIDDRLIPLKAIRVGRMQSFPDWMQPCNQVIPVPAGAHTISYQFRPTRMWRHLCTLSNVILVTWLGLTAPCGLRRLFATCPEAAGRIGPGAPSEAFQPQGQAEQR
jgi:hypothetical protein